MTERARDVAPTAPPAPTAATAATAATARAPPMFAELRRVMTRNPTTPTLPMTIPLQATHEASVVTVGRERSDVNLDCDIVTRLISRKHAEIKFDPETGAHVLEDSNSTNGTYFNGNLVSTGPLPLQHGDIVSFGGPANVNSCDNGPVQNPFRYQYWRIRPFAEWKILEAETRRRPAKRARTVASIPEEEPGAVVAGLREWLDEEMRCTICTHFFISPHTIDRCGHTFCHACISRWISEHRSPHCPVCRHRIIKTPVFPITACRVSQTLLDRYVLPSLSPEDAEARRVLARDNAAEQIANQAARVRRATFVQIARPTIVPAEVQIDAIGSMTRSRVASSRPRIRVVSRHPAETTCRQCRAVIPPLFLRFERTTTAAGVSTNEYFHPNFHCLRSIRGEIADTVVPPELSEQEKRVAKGVIDLLSSRGQN